MTLTSDAGLLVTSIRLTRTSLPSHAILGEDVVLECGYDMEGDKLYSVKWYRYCYYHDDDDYYYN